jgi:Rrf2 family protein
LKSHRFGPIFQVPMLSLNRKTDYALVALAHLARHAPDAEAATSARAVAEAYGLPAAMLANLLKALHRAGLVASTRGASGGYYLARPAEAITLADVIAAIEDGPVQVALCCADEPADSDECLACRIERLCPISGAIKTLNERFAAIFDGLTLQHLLDGHVAESIRHAVGNDDEKTDGSNNTTTSALPLKRNAP